MAFISISTSDVSAALRGLCLFLLTCIFLFLTASVTLAASLKVEVTGLENNDGDVHIALYDRAEAFPDSDGMFAERTVVISDLKVSTVFVDIVAGRYAIAVYHDVNGNHDFDQGLFGLPQEAYGFSSGARAFLGPPSFQDAAFDVAEPETRIVIDLGN